MNKEEPDEEEEDHEYHPACSCMRCILVKADYDHEFEVVEE